MFRLYYLRGHNKELGERLYSGDSFFPSKPNGNKNILLSRLRKEGSPVSSGIQPKQEDKGKDNACDTQRNKNAEEGKGDNYQMEVHSVKIPRHCTQQYIGQVHKLKKFQKLSERIIDR